MGSNERRFLGGLAIAALCLAACGHHDVVVGVRSEASVPTPPKPFGAPRLVEGLFDEGVEMSDPTLSGDMLEIYFASPKNGGHDIWRSTRDSLSELWATPSLVTELSDDSYEAEPSLSGDGLTIWFTSNRTMKVDRLWVAHRATISEPWGTAELLDWGISESERGPSTDVTDLNLVFYSIQATDDQTDLKQATRESRGDDWGTPRDLSEINSDATDWDPGLFADGLGLMFSSTRDGQSAPDFYETSRPSLAKPFSEPVARTELNSSDAEGDPWLSNDGRYVIFASARSGLSRLYEARR